MDLISNKMGSSRHEKWFLENQNVYQNNSSRCRPSYLTKSYAPTVTTTSRGLRQAFHLLI